MRIAVLVLVVLASTARADDSDEPGSAPLAASDALRVIEVRPHVGESVIVVAPAKTTTAKAIVLLFPGGNGALGLSDAGLAHGADNFVVRARARFADAGIVAIVVDVPGDHAGGVGAFRTTAAAARDVGAIVAWARTTWSKLPVYLVGTSRGTITAANAAARGVAIDGLVLASSVTAGKKEKLGDLATAKIRARTLVVHHVRDACPASPLAGAERLAKALRATWKTFDGGAEPTGDACSSNSYHGYLGLDADVVAAIVDFISAAP